MYYEFEEMYQQKKKETQEEDQPWQPQPQTTWALEMNEKIHRILEMILETEKLQAQNQFKKEAIEMIQSKIDIPAEPGVDNVDYFAF